jgi:thioredoxin reductase (NADPH)
MGGITLNVDLGRLGKAEGEPQGEGDSEIVERELIIIGGGPAGLTAGLYAGRAQLKPLILMGQAFGGQAATTSEMENYPGFPDGIGGMQLAEQMVNHAQRFGAEIAYEEVTAVELGSWPFIVRTYGTVYRTKAIIICTGASPRKLGVPGESQFIGRGVSFCATCDGYFYREKTVTVVGGGDSALDEGLYLTRFANEVIIIHRRDQLRGTPILQNRAKANPKVRFVWNSVVDEVVGDTVVTGVRVRNIVTGEQSIIPCDGLFVYVGLTPNVQLFKDQLTLTPEGYIQTDRRQRTNVPGVFAAGDVQDPHFRQVVIAAGSGASASIEAVRFLAEKEFEEQERQGR